MFHQQALRRMSRGELDETYLNPVLPGFNPDPSVIRVKSDYFLTTSSFEYTPGAPIYHSIDLIQWTLIGHALTRKSQLDIKAPEPGGGVWACTLRYHDEWFYLTTCVWDRYRPQESHERAWPRGFYVKTQDIWNSDSWTDPVYFDQPGFDQDLFWDENGKVYLSTTCRKVDRDPESKLKDQGVHICSVDLETGNSTSAAVLIRESASGVAEGSHILKRGKYYYLFTAEGGTESGHSEYCFRSEESPLGPWEECPHNPLLQNSTDQEVQNTGHCDFVQDPLGRWFAFCLAVRPQKTETGWTNSLFGRETFIMPMSWSNNDWPVLNQGYPLGLKSVARGLYTYEPPRKWHDSFTASTLQLGWYRKNTAVKSSDVSLSSRPGFLRMRPGPYKLSTPASPTALFRKLTHSTGVWKTRLSFFPDVLHSEAGTVAYWNYFTWASIGIRRNSNGEREIAFTSTDGDTKTTNIALPKAEVDLVIGFAGTTVQFGFQEVKPMMTRVPTDASIIWIGQVSSESLTKSPPVGNPFTGLMLGIYAFAEVDSSASFADFVFAEFL